MEAYHTAWDMEPSKIQIRLSMLAKVTKPKNLEPTRHQFIPKPVSKFASIRIIRREFELNFFHWYFCLFSKKTTSMLLTSYFVVQNFAVVMACVDDCHAQFRFSNSTCCLLRQNLKQNILQQVLDCTKLISGSS